MPEPEADPSAPPPGEEDGSAIGELLGTEGLQARAEAFLSWLSGYLLTLDVAIQALILLAALAPAALFGPQLRKFVSGQIASRAPYGILRRAASAIARIATPVALYLILQAAALSLAALGRPNALVGAALSLLTAWIVIRLVTLVIRSPFWSQAAFYVAWPIAALDAFGVLGRVVRELDAFAVPIGIDPRGEAISYSAFDFLRTIVIFGLLFWIASLAGRFIKARIGKIEELTASFKALLSKVLDVVLPVIALLVALQVVGFPFATLAVFGGAVGLGIGLGLQRTISNFFAGFTLVADKSIKPGDVIEIGSTFGWITEMNARYVSIRTRDGMEHLIPNDKFLENGVVNWSHSDRCVRLHARFSVAYSNRDLRAVKALAEEVACGVERVLQTPAPICNLAEFAEGAIAFDLRFWINDPASGVTNVRSAVMLAVWDALHDHGFAIPVPQLDVNLRQAPGAADEHAVAIKDSRRGSLARLSKPDAGA